MTDDEVSKHYGRYEARLGASMTKTLGSSALRKESRLVKKRRQPGKQKKQHYANSLDKPKRKSNHPLSTAGQTCSN